jgi:hypothetical protein
MMKAMGALKDIFKPSCKACQMNHNSLHIVSFMIKTCVWLLTIFDAIFKAKCNSLVNLRWLPANCFRLIFCNNLAKFRRTVA